MARFRFGLQAVLDLRERQEREHQRVVARLERERLDLEDMLRGYQGTIRAAKDDLRGSMGRGGGRVDAASLRLDAGAAMGMQIRAHQAVLRLAGVHRRLETARRLLMAATRARRAIEVLKERRLAEWQGEEKRKEGVLLDEAGTMNAARRAVASRSGECGGAGFAEGRA